MKLMKLNNFVKINKIKHFLLINQDFIVGSIIIFLFIFLIMPPRIWDPGEENYLGYAWRRFSYENLEFSALRDEANHRFVFEYIVGFIINLIGFEWTHAIGRILVSILFATAFMTFFISLNFSLVTSCILFIFFLFFGESIIGREWFFGSFEGKAIAYPFVLYSFSRIIRNKFTQAYLLLALATYFHILIGLFWFFCTIIVQFYKTKNIKKMIFISFQYIILCAPLFLIILHDRNPEKLYQYGEPSANWIYTYFRNPHHLAPFVSAEMFQRWYPGILRLLALFFSSLIIYFGGTSQEKDGAKLVLALNSYLIISLIVVYFDTEGILGKFYLFRTSSIILIFNLCLYAWILKNRLTKNYKPIKFVILIVSIAFMLPSLKGHKIIYKNLESGLINEQPVSAITSSLKDFFPSPQYLFTTKEIFGDIRFREIIQRSQIGDVFLIEPKLDMSNTNFERKYNRPTLVAYKFIPTTKQGVLRWYNLLKQRENLFLNGCPSSIIKNYPIKYLLADINNLKIESCGKTIYQGDGQKIIKLDK